MAHEELLACNTSVALVHRASRLGEDVECSSCVKHNIPLVPMLTRQQLAIALLFASVALASTPLWLLPFAFQFLAASLERFAWRRLTSSVLLIVFILSFKQL